MNNQNNMSIIITTFFLIVFLGFTLIYFETNAYKNDIELLRIQNANLTNQLEISMIQEEMCQDYSFDCDHKYEVMQNLSNTFKSISSDCYNEMEELEAENNKLYLFNYQMFSRSSRFKQILIDIAEANDYVADEYDCTEYSHDLKYKLRSYGWKAEQVNVVSDCDSGYFDKENCLYFEGRHSIVKVKDVYIEAVTGDIIDPSNYKIYGIIR